METEKIVNQLKEHLLTDQAKNFLGGSTTSNVWKAAALSVGVFLLTYRKESDKS